MLDVGRTSVNWKQPARKTMCHKAGQVLFVFQQNFPAWVQLNTNMLEIEICCCLPSPLWNKTPSSSSSSSHFFLPHCRFLGLSSRLILAQGKPYSGSNGAVAQWSPTRVSWNLPEAFRFVCNLSSPLSHTLLGPMCCLKHPIDLDLVKIFERESVLCADDAACQWVTGVLRGGFSYRRCGFTCSAVERLKDKRKWGRYWGEGSELPIIWCCLSCIIPPAFKRGEKMLMKLREQNNGSWRRKKKKNKQTKKKPSLPSAFGVWVWIPDKAGIPFFC